MSALVAFEAAARHASFKNAAKELNVTPAAISHQVKTLEGELHCALFRRHHRGVELTETGAYLFVTLQRDFESMNEAIDQLRQRSTRAAVTIRISTAVSALWLTPKLAQFWKAHGDISVAQIVSDTPDAPLDCDLSIHYGDLTRERDQCHPLFHDQIMALGSPEFARTHDIEQVEDLARLPLIHLDSSATNWTDWKDWFKASGYRGPLKNSHRVNNYMIALQAACDDMGAVLGWIGLARPYLESGQLIPLLPNRVDTVEDFYVRLHANPSPRAQMVYDWLVKAT